MQPQQQYPQYQQPMGAAQPMAQQFNQQQYQQPYNGGYGQQQYPQQNQGYYHQ
jgi:hypothetical protein